MTEHKPTIEEEHEALMDYMALPRRQFIELNLQWIKEQNDGKLMKPENPLECPLNQWVVFNHKKCNRQMVPNTASCPLCGKPMCPDCNIHTAEPLSRVTGYLQVVSGWNEAKKQEFKDRTRHDLDGSAPRGQ